MQLVGGVIITVIVFVVCYSIAQILSKIGCLCAVHYSSMRQMTAPAPNRSQLMKQGRQIKECITHRVVNEFAEINMQILLFLKWRLSPARYHLNERARKGGFRQTREGRDGRPGRLRCEEQSERRSLNNQPSSRGKSPVKPFTLSYIKNFTWDV